MKDTKYFLDAGTTWSKILAIKSSKYSNFNDDGSVKSLYDSTNKVIKSYKILPTASLACLDIEFSAATGHSAGLKNVLKYENEVVALANGAKNALLESNIVLDLGSRDIKWVKFKDGKFSDMDWNTSCASATGATIEMLLKFYNVDVNELEVQDEKYAVTCGIFGLEKIMDDVAKGFEARIAISKFINGIAFNAWSFTKNPDKLCISGGFCENKCFVDSLKKYCEVEVLGRFVLVDGLYSEYQIKHRTV